MTNLVKEMFIIHEKPVHSPFCGDGVESIVSDPHTLIILAHTRGWDDKSVVEEFSAPLKGKAVKDRGKGWRKVTGERLSTAQEWAWELTGSATEGASDFFG